MHRPKALFKTLIALIAALVFFGVVAALTGLAASFSINLLYAIIAISVLAAIYVGLGGRSFFFRILYDDLPGAAYLAPWYFNAERPGLIKGGQPLKWRYIEKLGADHVGVLALEDVNKDCLALVKIYTYLLPFDGSRRFLVWSRTLEKGIGPQRLKILQFDTDDLRPIDDLESRIRQLTPLTDIFLLNSRPASKVELEIDPAKEVQHVQFPDNFKLLDEFIVITELENVYDDKNWYNTVLLVFKPKEGSVFVYPQDWFNKPGPDFGYQWITRATRDPETGFVFGEGIRISDFVLDETNRQLRARNPFRRR